MVLTDHAPFDLEGGYGPLKQLPRKKIPVDIRSLARSYTAETIRRLAAIMRDPGADEPASTSVSAAALLLGYGHGKPSQKIEGDQDNPITITIRKILGGDDDDGKSQ